MEWYREPDLREQKLSMSPYSLQQQRQQVAWELQTLEPISKHLLVPEHCE